MWKRLFTCVCVVAFGCVEAEGAARLAQESSELRVLTAWADVGDLIVVRVTFSDNVVGALDPFFYLLEDIFDPNNSISVSNVVYGVSSNTVVLTLSSPRDPLVTYRIQIAYHAIQDRYGNPLPDPTSMYVTEPATFQNGIYGYVGTHDTRLEQGTPNANHGSDITIICDGNPLNHGLLRFDDVISVFGGSPWQVPLGSIINRAILRLYTTDPSAANTPVRMLRMLAPWNEDATWNTLGNGIDQTNGVEAGVTDALVIANVNDTFLEIDVAAAMQSWANGASNYGWAFLPTGGDGWSWASSEYPDSVKRPALMVEYLYEPPPCQIVEQPRSMTVRAGDPIVLSVGSLGSALEYQWFKRDVAILDANGASYTSVSSKLTDSGGYFVVVRSGESKCTSEVATITVFCDDYPVQLVSAVGNPDQTTISLEFNDWRILESTQDITNYAISGGLSIIGVSNYAGRVILITSGPREIGRNYTLTIQDLRDSLYCFNTIYPNPTVVTLTQDVRILSFDAVWKYQNEGLDLGTNWVKPTYDDRAWPLGPGLLGFETTQSTLQALSNQNAFVRTVLGRVNRTTGLTNITDYFRTMVNFPYLTDDVAFILRHATDDGAVFYVNGVESARFNMNSGEVNYLTTAPLGPAEGVVRSITNLTGFVCGGNSLAVEVHQTGVTSGDVLFGAELIARVPLFLMGSCERLRAVLNLDGTVTISWGLPGTLEQADRLGDDWGIVRNAVSPFRVPAEGVARFYRLRGF